MTSPTPADARSVLERLQYLARCAEESPSSALRSQYLDQLAEEVLAALPAPAEAENDVWRTVKIPQGRLWQKIDHHRQLAKRARQRGETTDPVICAYAEKVAALHEAFAEELNRLLPTPRTPGVAHDQ